MARVSPIVRSVNAGEFSALMEGRSDIDRYPASCRIMLNTVAAPQGPGISRSGSQFINSVYDNSALSALVSFVFSETDFYMIEFANQRVRFFTETGLLTYTPVAVTAMTTGPFVFTSATLGASVGDQVAFSNFDDEYNLNGVVANITNVAGTDYTVDVTFPALATVTTFMVARVYHVTSPYTSAQMVNVKDTPSLDVVYLFNGAVKTYKLQRADTYSWSFVEVALTDGPYLPENETATTLTPTATGKATPDMTGASAPSGTASASTEAVGFEAWKAFDSAPNKTYWQSTTDQTGTIQYAPASGFVCDGYSMHIPVENADTSYTSKDHAPSDWQFEGYTGSAWVTLDKQQDYVLWDNNKSVFFKLANETSYQQYRIVIDGLKRNGTIKPRIRSVVLRGTASASLTINASAVTGINNGQGFLTTDVGRVLRMKGSDNTWRWLKITARNSTTQIVATLMGEPFPDLLGVTKWRLGAYSDTTGYPNVGAFHDDRLFQGGTDTLPDFFSYSMTGSYESMSPTTDTGEVLSTSGGTQRLNARRLSRIKWMASNKDGLGLGTGSKEYLVHSIEGRGKPIDPSKGLRASDAGSRGSSDCPPAEVDAQLLYVGRGGRTVREFAYTYESDNYKSPSMSSLASHLGVSPFVDMAYANEPFGIDWILKQDGNLVGLTYNRDENVIGWHRHDFDGVVESIAVLPSSDLLRDVLWMIVRREINGGTVRYVEKLTQFWDFGMTLADAWYVDSGLRYVGAATTEIYGLSHLEGRDDIYGLADGVPVGPFTVAGGMVTLPQEASNVVLGIGFESVVATSRLENGARDGTAQGKVKRTHEVSLLLWDSYGGEVGTWDPQEREIVYAPVEYESTDASMVDVIELKNGLVGPITPAAGYEKDGSIYWRRRKDQPLPFNVVAVMPQLDTQDG